MKNSQNTKLPLQQKRKHKKKKAIKYTTRLANKILQGVAAGQSIAEQCTADDMPSQEVIYLWIVQNPDFAQKLNEAREQSTNAFIDQILVIADGMPPPEDDKTSQETIQRSKIRIETRKWLIDKLISKKSSSKAIAQSEPGKDITEQLERALLRKKVKEEKTTKNELK